MLDPVLSALAAPRRRQILQMLRGGELTAGQIAAHFDVTRPAVSQHLKVLQKAELVGVRKRGTQRLYRLRPEHLAELQAYLEGFWQDGLDRLRQAAEAEERSLDAIKAG